MNAWMAYGFSLNYYKNQIKKCRKWTFRTNEGIEQKRAFGAKINVTVKPMWI